MTALAPAAKPATREPRVAILGDSITYDGRWATRVESALRATPRFADAQIVNFGLSCETVSGLSEPGHAGGKFPRPCLHERLERILQAYQPDLVLACYGMNDGIHPAAEGHRFIADSICRQLWPILGLPGSPESADGDALAILLKRNELLKLAWLTRTRHIRPGIPTGLPLAQAEDQAAKLMDDYRNAGRRKASDSPSTNDVEEP